MMEKIARIAETGIMLAGALAATAFVLGLLWVVVTGGVR